MGRERGIVNGGRGEEETEARGEGEGRLAAKALLSCLYRAATVAKM